MIWNFLEEFLPFFQFRLNNTVQACDKLPKIGCELAFPTGRSMEFADLRRQC